MITEYDFLQPSLTIEDAESESESDESYYPELGSEPDTEDDDEVGVTSSCVLVSCSADIQPKLVGH